MVESARTPFVAFDVETTGLHPLCDRIVEIGAVRFGFDGCGETFESLVRPGRAIPPEATAVHGINGVDVSDAPSFADIGGDLLSLMDGAVFVAHNASFDAGFLLAECNRARVTPPTIAAIDTCALARVAFPSQRRYSLDALVDDLALERNRAHRALDDASASASLLLRSFEALGVRSDADLSSFFDAFGPPVPIERLGFHIVADLPAPYEPIARALDRDESVVILYEDRFGTRSKREIKPLRVASMRGALVLEAHCKLRGECRCFRLDRIREIDA